jgi:hypothetical protein
LVIPASRQDGRGDAVLGADRIDREQGTGQRQPLQEQQNGGDPARRAGHVLLPEHQALAAGPGRDKRRLAAFAARVGERGLAVHGDDVPRRRAPPLDPAREAGLEQRGTESADDLPHRVVAGNTVQIGQEAAQEGELLVAPKLHLPNIIGTGQVGRAQEKEDRRQGGEHLGHLTLVLKDGKAI